MSPTSVDMGLAYELAARSFEQPTQRVLPQWPTPGALAQTLDPATVQTPALEAIDQALVDVAEGTTRRLMVFMPPQEGKSVRTSQRFVEWMLIRNPELRVAIVSFADEMARRWGADIKLDLETFNGDEESLDLRIRLRADSKAAGRWQIAGHKGGVYCTGVAGSLTGKPVDLLVIDDPIKDLEQAQSSQYRARAQRFWQGVAVPRMAPETRVVLIQTRWHEDDLAGWLIRNDTRSQWRVLSIPAVAESTDDPLGRAPGEAMISARGVRDWQQIRADVGEYVWSALYQQRPQPAAGGIFKRASIRHWAPTEAWSGGRQMLRLGDQMFALDDGWRFLTVDLAASVKTSADYTVAGVWAIAPWGDLVLLDGARQRVDPAEHWPLVRGLRQKWAADTVYVESRMFGTTLVYEAGREGVPVAELLADTDKLTRALPAAARNDTGRLWLPPMTSAPWISEWIDELVTFPNAVHDDVVDVVSYAARVAAAHWLPAQAPGQVERQMAAAVAGSPVIEQAAAAATGGGWAARQDPLQADW